MSFQPFAPSGGLSGWRFVQATLPQQRAAFAAGPVLERELAYFRDRIGTVTSAEELVGDYRLLSVALAAFGLSDEIGNRFLIRKVLEEGTTAPDALANKLSDRRYRALSQAFGFGDFATPNTALSTFPDQIAEKFTERGFERALGETRPGLRLALNARRELVEIAGSSGSNRTKWFTIMGTPPLRSVMETALALPKSFAALPIDRQLQEFQVRAEAAFGTDDVAALAAAPVLDRLLDRFAALDGLGRQGPGGPSSPALVLLRGF
ncbi:DUF1217 domain-containing protein [Jannaschia ovalis]|uniref:DUF1217 domain-containing protein n=1 Tax=Jannaschia ovalis TaxID=3038773 RepID=A0ABY8LFW0_9RHOB|nr:DUF1217 domain-containing protein [Jannaschia sp. GRR-S6-38]WGH80185.1 DUF1217 domain-containing protein [Jannaschia sp. GRR-S6-38]